VFGMVVDGESQAITTIEEVSHVMQFFNGDFAGPLTTIGQRLENLLEESHNEPLLWRWILSLPLAKSIDVQIYADPLFNKDPFLGQMQRLIIENDFVAILQEHNIAISDRIWDEPEYSRRGVFDLLDCLSSPNRIALAIPKLLRYSMPKEQLKDLSIWLTKKPLMRLALLDNEIQRGALPNELNVSHLEELEPIFIKLLAQNIEQTQQLRATSNFQGLAKLAIEFDGDHPIFSQETLRRLSYNALAAINWYERDPLKKGILFKQIAESVSYAAGYAMLELPQLRYFRGLQFVQRNIRNGKMLDLCKAGKIDAKALAMLLESAEPNLSTTVQFFADLDILPKFKTMLSRNLIRSRHIPQDLKTKASEYLLQAEADRPAH
jgi:hypothetical protein